MHVISRLGSWLQQTDISLRCIFAWSFSSLGPKYKLWVVKHRAPWLFSLPLFFFEKKAIQTMPRSHVLFYNDERQVKKWTINLGEVLFSLLPIKELDYRLEYISATSFIGISVVPSFSSKSCVSSLLLTFSFLSATNWIQFAYICPLMTKEAVTLTLQVSLSLSHIHICIFK